MDILKKRVNRARKNAIYREIPIYTVEEASKKGIRFVHWKSATPDFLHVETDDGYVVPVIYMRKYGEKWFIKTEIGPAFLDKKGGKLSWEDRKAVGDFWNLVPWKGTWIDKEVNSPRFKRAISAYAKQIFDGKVDIDAIGKMIRPDVRNSTWLWRRYLKNTRVQEIVTEELEKLYTEQGITKRTVIALEQEALQMARDSGDGNLLLKVANTLGKRLGMDNETKLLTTNSVEMSQITKDIAEQIETSKKLRLTQVKSHPKSEIIENVQTDEPEES